VKADRQVSIEVFAPARLHLGFLDLHGGLGRKFGSLGLTLEELGVELTMEASPSPMATGPGAARALDYLAKAAHALALPAAAAIRLLRLMPEHAGFGSGTQLGLAIAAGLARLHGREVDPAQAAMAVERGARSGIGIGAFAAGGVILDGGRGAMATPAPVIARLPFPPAWRVVLILDPRRAGIHGAAETAAFAALPDFSPELAGHLCRLVVMRFLPALAEEDFAAASTAIGEIQARLGDHFATAQNGRFTSPAVAEALSLAQARGFTGLGQSSWGPTGFVFAESEKSAASLVAALEEALVRAPELQFRICQGRNHGAIIKESPRTKEG